MAVTRDIYCDFTNGRLVQSNVSATPVLFPKVFHQDNLRLVIHPLEVDPSRAPNLGPFAQIDPTGMSLKVGIFDSTGDTTLALQSTWTVDGNTLVGTLNCNTAEMTAEIGSADSITGILEFEFTDSDGNKITIQQDTLTIEREYIVSATPDPIPNETFLPEAASLAMFLLKEGTAGEGRIWVSPDGTKKVFQYLDNNGVMQYAPVII